MATGPTPQRRVERVATSAPMNDEAPPTPAMTPISAGLTLELVEREQEPGRPEDAPQHRHQHLGADERAQHGVAAHEPQPVADLVEHRLSLGAWRWRRLGPPDGQQQNGRDQVGDRVDDDRDRAGQQLDEETADTEPGELGDRAARRQRAVRLDQTLALDDGRQIGVVRRVEERGQHRGQARDHDELPQGERPEHERDRDRAKQDRPPQIRPDEHGPPPQPVHPRAGHQAHDQTPPRRPCCAARRPRSGRRPASGSRRAAARRA